MTKTSARRAALSCALLATTAFCGLTASPAAAQTAPPPKFQSVDGNGVDLTSGWVGWSMTEGSIGSGEGAVSLTRSWAGTAGWTDNWSGRAYQQTSGGTSQVVVELGGISDRFSVSGGTYTSLKGDGATLTGSAGSYVYTAADGTVVEYSGAGPDAGLAMSGPGCTLADSGTCGIPTSITRPNGMKFTLNWDVLERCFQYDAELNCISGGAYFRFRGVSSSANYSFTISYLTDTPGTGVPVSNWYKRTGVTFTNLASAPSTLPSVSYTLNSSGIPTALTDTGGRSWGFSYATNGHLSGVKRPGVSSDTSTWSYGTNGVSSATIDGVTTAYAVTISGSTRTTTVTDALSNASTVVADASKGRVTSITDPLSRTTSFTYDTSDRPKRTTLPEGNYVELSYDSRGNVTETRQVAKSGSGLPDVVATATFASSCTNPVTCNKPTSTTDARGDTTDYTYDSTHGGLLTATAPAATTGATRPQIRYTYGQVTAVTGEPVYLLTDTSQCQTLSSCSGSADEVKSHVDYGSSNLLPVSTSAGNGSGTLTATNAMTYDSIGNLLTVDGPLSGSADTVTFRYNAARERVGTISPDPDGAGALKRRAERVTINSEGLVTKVEAGNVDGTSDTDWANFTPAQAAETAYDANARPVTSKLTSGSTVYALSQASYDALGRAECVAQRMDPNDFGLTLPSACSLTSPAGSFGPDRIVKMIYDAAGQATQVNTAYGTSEEANEVTGTYTNNGLVETVTDAESNKTTYQYDGHDRLLKTFYPSTTKGAGTSSTTDYEQLTYENTASNTRTSGTVASYRNRANETIAFAYDALGRLTTKDLPGSEPDVTFGYDLLGRMISASKTNENMSFGYDALGRLTSQTNPAGTVEASWDLAGRRIQIKWPDTKYVDYDYLVTGEMEKVRFNGATSGANVLTTYGYDQLGRRSSITRGNGTSTSYAYDAVSRLDTLSHDLSGTTQDVSYTYGYNPASQIVSVNRSNDAYAWTKHGSGTTSTTANGLNQIASWNGMVTHDAKGNITSDGTNSFAYSSENLMTSVTIPPWGSDTVAYDPLMRVRGTGTQQRFLRFQDDMLAEYYGSTLVERMIPGAGEDETAATLNRFDTRSWYYADERGSTVGKAGDAGTATIYAYDEYGRPGTNTPPRMGYTGQMLFITDQVYDYKNRMYHPGLGRFLQTDPIGYDGGMNLYAYVGGDPVNGTDPSGATKVEICTGTRLCPHHDGGGPGSGVAQLFGGRGNGGGGGWVLRKVREGGPAQGFGNDIIVTSMYAWVYVGSGWSLNYMRDVVGSVAERAFDRFKKYVRETRCLVGQAGIVIEEAGAKVSGFGAKVVTVGAGVAVAGVATGQPEVGATGGAIASNGAQLMVGGGAVSLTGAGMKAIGGDYSSFETRALIRLAGRAIRNPIARPVTTNTANQATASSRRSIPACG
ncbi:MAG TPA: RHS repeat-associated core domain-containing protein [Allosphingosinicella sp.]|nr:RHS repeat-associated core domain-containing protein [Allosphingosinicella sp.]